MQKNCIALNISITYIVKVIIVSYERRIPTLGDLLRVEHQFVEGMPFVRVEDPNGQIYRFHSRRNGTITLAAYRAPPNGSKLFEFPASEACQFVKYHRS